MEICLLCLNMIEDKLDSMSISSAQWKKLGVANKLEKYFWSLIVIQPKSWICLSCWQQVDDFHKFYLQVEQAHMNICKIEVEESKVGLTSQISNGEVNDESNTDNMGYGFLEPEIQIDQIQAHNIMEPLFDKMSELQNETDVGHMSKAQICQTSKDPLERSKRLGIEKKKKNLCNRKELELEKSIEDEPKSLNMEDLFILDFYKDSDSEEDASYLTDKEASINGNIKGSKSSGKSRIKCEESDNFLAQHFKQMNCNICQESLQNFSAIHKHFLEMHKQRGYILCCNRKYFNRRDLVDHIHCHKNPDHFKCVKCNKVLSDRLRLKKHVTRLHGSKEVVRRHSCDVCEKSYLDDYYLRRHKLTHLSEEEKKFPCKECDKLYGSSDLLHRHMQAVHLKKFVKICYICGKSLNSTTELKIHMNKHEGISEPVINCDMCGLRLTTERGLKRHKDSQHPVDGKKDHHCPTCPKISPTLKALRKHINTMHKQSLLHECTICQKAFKRTEVLREHMASHTGTPLYTCPWCPKTFNSNGNMHAHRKKMHPKEWQEAKLLKYSGNLKTTIVDKNS